ncbi:hypothetical protein HELRODRAFT_63543 [Helobdella robusta]|uniref:Fas apoptotic inhibitory molecule 1 n=1 Tax=Helobdella robusta TaxID=6412 RepID=T1FXH1_HELRO|nr:hypothetical protein HELRODRAFT_63543 [Helobdella robusta]ESO12820.1 hypothetical protein HELRODRAFT_63543 [Helobdella robusta]
MAKSDLVADWDVELSDKMHKIQFEHGSLSGKRVIWVDDEEVMRKDFVFDLVGSETFNLMGNRMKISISCEGFDYMYTLTVNNVNLEKFTKQQSLLLQTWNFEDRGNKHRVVLEKDSLDVWADGKKVETQIEFVNDGTVTHFTLEPDKSAWIMAGHSGKRKVGMVYKLVIDGCEIKTEDS